MRRRTWLLAGTGLAVAVVAALLAWPQLQVYAGTAPPPQFLEPLHPVPTGGHRPVLGVAHNAGNNPGTTAAALAHGAAVIEIDVISAHGEPAAGRVQPWPWLADRVFRGPSLVDAWRYASPARIVKLDLQQNDHGLLRQVGDFVAVQRTSPHVMISSRDASALLYLRSRLPHTTLLFSAGFPDAIRRIQSDATLRSAVDGVTAFEGLVTSDFVDWAHRHHLLVIAWTVNDGNRLEQLLALGADGVTTQNLAVLDALAR